MRTLNRLWIVVLLATSAGLAACGGGPATDTAANQPVLPTLGPTNTPAPSADTSMDEGIASFSDGEFEVALESFNEAIEFDPEFADAYYNRALTYLSLDNYDAALADLTTAIELDSENAQYLQARAGAYVNLAQWDEAIADVSALIELDPGNLQLIGARAELYSRNEQYLEAADDYGAMLELTDDPAIQGAFHNLRGLAYLEAEEYELALAEFDAALESDPEFTNAISNKADAYYKMGDLESAIAMYDQLVELVPDSPYSYNNRAYSFARMNVNLDKALEDANYALELFPDGGFIWDTRGFIYFQMGDYNAALADFDKAIELGEYYSYYWRGRANEALGNVDAAIADYKEFVRRSPENAEQEELDDAAARITALGG